ncbi:MAG: hypothetical protein ABIO43_12085 [Sphingomicrobium sp.]
MIYDYRRGSTILIGLDAVKGDVAAVSAITAELKALPPGGNVPDDATPVATFVIAPRAASPTQPAGWTLSLSAIVSQGLTPGLYRTDARIEIAGGVVFTEPLDLRIAEPITVPQ